MRGVRYSDGHKRFIMKELFFQIFDCCSADSWLVLGIGSAARRQYQRLESSSRSFDALIEETLKNFNGLIFRNEGRSLIGFLKIVIRGVVSDRYGS